MGILERKEREKERRRQQIMVAAKKVFAVSGFSKSTMEDIAKEAELSPGTIYLYFRNKDELYASLSVRILQYLNMRIKNVIENHELQPEQYIGALKQAMYDVYDFDPLIVITLFQLQSNESLKNLSPYLLDEIIVLSRDSIRAIACIFEKGVEKGYFIDRHPIALADIFWSLFSGIVLLEERKKVINPEDKSFMPNIDFAFELFARGITR